MVTYQKHYFNLNKRVERRRPLSNEVFFSVYGEYIKPVEFISFISLGFDYMTERLKSLLMNSYASQPKSMNYLPFGRIAKTDQSISSERETETYTQRGR